MRGYERRGARPVAAARADQNFASDQSPRRLLIRDRGSGDGGEAPLRYAGQVGLTERVHREQIDERRAHDRGAPVSVTRQRRSTASMTTISGHGSAPAPPSGRFAQRTRATSRAPELARAQRPHWRSAATKRASGTGPPPACLFRSELSDAAPASAALPDAALRATTLPLCQRSYRALRRAGGPPCGSAWVVEVGLL